MCRRAHTYTLALARAHTYTLALARAHTYTVALARTLTLYLLAHMLLTHMNQTSQVGFVPRMRTFPRIRQHKNVNFLRIVWKQSQCDGTMVFWKCVPRAFECVKRACVRECEYTRAHLFNSISVSLNTPVRGGAQSLKSEAFIFRAFSWICFPKPEWLLLNRTRSAKASPRNAFQQTDKTEPTKPDPSDFQWILILLVLQL